LHSRRGIEFRHLVDTIPGFVVVTDPRGKPVFASKRLLDYTGWAVDAMDNWGPLVHPDDLEGVLHVWDKGLQTGVLNVHEFRILGADGNYRWFQSRMVAHNDQAGLPARWYLLTSVRL
jgi:PAS domain S-box-containing protein